MADNREEDDLLPNDGLSVTHPVDQVWGTLRLDRPVAEILDEMRGSASEERVSSASSETPAELSAEFESLLESMQTPAARKGVDAAFNATPEELGRAAVKAARRPGCSSGTS